MNLTKYKIGDVCEIVSKSHTPIAGHTYNLYSLPSFDNNKNCEIIDGKYIESSKYVVPKKCILFNKLNVRFRRVWCIDHINGDNLCSTEFLPLVIDESKVDYQYFHYLLVSDSITEYLCGQNTNTSGSYKRIDPHNLLDIDIAVPDLLTQQKIGHLLSTLDRQISLLRSTNATLEAIAKQLYDYWFVQFDFPDANGKPYKSSGGEMVWNERLKREIPKGWKVVSVNEIASNVRGVAYTKDDLVDSNSGVLVLRGNNIQDNRLIYDSNVAYIPESLVSREQHIQPLDIIMTMSSGSKEHVGKCAMFQLKSEETFGAFLTKFTAKPHFAYLLFNFFNSQYFKSKIKTIACGTGINNLTNQTFDDIYMIVPEDNILLKFDMIQSKIFSEIGIMDKNSINLTQYRDTLLPLLMNGQATVGEEA